MHELHLTLADSKNCPECTRFLEELKGLAVQSGRVYHTYCEHSDQTYDVVTTSQGLHIMLGQLTKESQGHLCYLLQESLEEHNQRFLLFQPPTFEKNGEEGKGKPILVTQVQGGRSSYWTVLHLSNAN